jgi:purine-nucleoside phosphorylase
MNDPAASTEAADGLQPTPRASSIDEAIAASVAELRRRCAALQPRVAVLLGSGWSPLAEAVADPVTVPYADLPAFPAASVEGHRARVVAGRLGGAPVLVLCGRRHTYEGGRADAMAGAIRTLAALGCHTLVQTNAAGSLDPAMRPGEFMVIDDHLNMVQGSPLLAERDSRRFVDLRHAYDPGLADVAAAHAAALGLRLHRGVYAWVLGPQFETAAEIRMLRLLGADAVGMSTVPETILARHAGLRVLALSMMTNMACGLDDEPLGHEQTLAGAARAQAPALRLMTALLPDVAAAVPDTPAPPA